MELNNNFKSIAFLWIFCLCISQLIAQDELDLLEDDTIGNVFNYGVLINTQTTETVTKGSFEFRIQHRFGAFNVNDFNESVFDEFLGFDGSANIKFSFVYALTDNLQLGFGRSKINKVYDFEGKYRLLRQKEFGNPLSISAYFSTGLSAVDFPEVGPNEFQDDLTTPFEYKFAHRFTYNGQILLSKKFGNYVSLELNPTVIYKTLVDPGVDNYVFGATFGGRIKIGLTSAVLFEYTTKFNDRKNDFHDPVSLGFEIGTAGHAFQFFVSNTNQIIEQRMYFSSPLDFTNGDLLLGFNIKRTFWHGKNK